MSKRGHENKAPRKKFVTTDEFDHAMETLMPDEIEEQVAAGTPREEVLAAMQARMEALSDARL